MRSPLNAGCSILIVLCLPGAACGGEAIRRAPSKTLLIAVNAPFSQTPYVGETIATAPRSRRANAVVKTKEGTYRFRIKRYDTGLSTQTAVANVRRAVADGAVAIIDEGTGINASWRIAADADRPIGITYQGGDGLVDPVERPNVFRIAPTDHGTRFASPST